MTQSGRPSWFGLALTPDRVKALKPTEALALLLFMSRADYQGHVAPTTYEQLARGSQLKPETLRHAAATLGEKGLLTRRRGLGAIGFRVRCAAFPPTDSPYQEETSGSGRNETAAPVRFETSGSGRNDRPVADGMTSRVKTPEKETEKETTPSWGERTVVGGPPALAPPDAEEIELALEDARHVLGHELPDEVKRTLRSALRQRHIPAGRRRQAAADIADSFARNRGQWSDNASYWGKRLLAWSPGSTRPKPVSGPAAVDAVFARHGVPPAPSIDEEMRRVALR